MTPYLTDAEIAEICAPLVSGAAQLRYLQRLGLHAVRKPNGRPLLARAEFERVMVGRQAQQPAGPRPGQPDKGALVALFGNRRRASGATA